MSLLFTQVKSQVTTRQAAERYGVPVNRSGMAYCPFHDDRHPSMKIDERFYCFGCHTTGDVIDFTAKLFDLSLYDAAKKLANDFNIQPLPPGQSAPIPKLPAAVIERKEEQSVLKILIEYEQLLEKWKEEFVPSDPTDENLDDRFVHAVHHLPPLLMPFILVASIRTGPASGSNHGSVGEAMLCQEIVRISSTKDVRR